MSSPELPLLWMRCCGVQASLLQGVLPACRKQRAKAQVFGCGSIVPFMMHDPIGCRNRPFRTWTIQQVQVGARFDRPFLHHPKIPARQAGAFYLDGQIFELPAAGQFPAWLPWLRNLDNGRAD